jgi:ribosomal-protein-serine acetyltransferase
MALGLPLELGDAQTLRLVDERDAQELYELIAANRDYLSQWLPWPPAQTVEETVAFIRRNLEQLERNQGFNAVISEAGRIAGIVGFHQIDWQNRSTSIGYWLAPRYQGRGVMTSAVRALVDHAFGAWGLNRVEIRAAVGNTRSRAIPTRLGFAEEGVLREAERLGERYVDLVVYAVLAREWRTSRQVRRGRG